MPTRVSTSTRNVTPPPQKMYGWSRLFGTGNLKQILATFLKQIFANFGNVPQAMFPLLLFAQNYPQRKMDAPTGRKRGRPQGPVAVPGFLNEAEAIRCEHCPFAVDRSVKNFLREANNHAACHAALANFPSDAITLRDGSWHCGACTRSWTKLTIRVLQHVESHAKEHEAPESETVEPPVQQRVANVEAPQGNAADESAASLFEGDDDGAVAALLTRSWFLPCGDAADGPVALDVSDIVLRGGDQILLRSGDYAIVTAAPTDRTPGKSFYAYKMVTPRVPTPKTCVCNVW